MEIREILKKYNENEIIELIEKNRLNVSLEELLIYSINLGQNKVSNYLINRGVSFDYKDKLSYDAYLMATYRGNIDIIKAMMKKGLDLYKSYNIDNEETYAVSEVVDLSTLKFFEENNMPKEVFDKCVERIVRSTILTHDIDLLLYLIDNYKVDITTFTYKTPSGNYSILERTKMLIESMESSEMILSSNKAFSDKKYSKKRKKSYDKLNELEEEYKKLKEYYYLVIKIFEKQAE